MKLSCHRWTSLSVHGRMNGSLGLSPVFTQKSYHAKLASSDTTAVSLDHVWQPQMVPRPSMASQTVSLGL